jgi:Txe/YoeB family toxin of Txe-Axe toxin-antitoxin module
MLSEMEPMELPYESEYSRRIKEEQQAFFNAAEAA